MPQATAMQRAADKIEAAWSAEVAQCLAASPVPPGRVGAGGTVDGHTLVVCPADAKSDCVIFLTAKSRLDPCFAGRGWPL